jgi:hypothetical protein
MTCSICKKKESKEDPCNNCFSRMIEKRIRKNARINKIFRKGDSILVTDDLNEYFIKHIIKDLPVTIHKRKKVDETFIKKNKITKIATNWTLDDEAINTLKEFLTAKKTKQNKKTAKLLIVASDKELERFAKIHYIKFEPNKKDNKYGKTIEQMQQKYSDTKEKLYQSKKTLEKIGV